MKNRKLHLKRLLILFGIPCGLGLLYLIGWVMSIYIPCFKILEGHLIPTWGYYICYGILFGASIAMTCLIGWLLYKLFDWIFPKDDGVK